MSAVQLIQLPLHPSTGWEPTGNIPLAPALLAAVAGLPKESVFPHELLNTMGDAALADELKTRNPTLLGVTLYLWNRERTLHLIRRLKQWNPDLLVVAGGPEVTPDNHILLQETSIDLFVAGEGESFAADVLSPRKLRSIIATGTRLLGPVVDTESPERWPDPYRTGHIAPPAGGSVHIETQRGCPCLCSYCAYRRTSPVPRLIPADVVLERMRMLKEMGAEELVFLDPTFNSRSDLPDLLHGMTQYGFDCFAEVRGDLIHTPEIPESLAKAGFSSLEVGLQTMDTGVLKAIGRGGNPESVIHGAALLSDCGITPVMDLILGLPGDNPENIETAAKELVSRNLHEQVQTFCLSVLPGTELRANAQALGISYRDCPPYSIIQSGKYTIDQLLQARENVSDILGYDADPPPRPVLSSSFPCMETFVPQRVNSDISPSVRHGVLHIDTPDAWAHREAILGKISERRERDPFCPLDVIIRSEKTFPLDLLEMISDTQEPACYTTEKAHIYGLSGLIRLAVVARPETDPGWLTECSDLAVTVIETDSPVSLPGGQTGLLIKGTHDLSQLSALYSGAPHLVFFAEEELELLWNLDVLGLG